MSEALKSNTTLIKLNLESEDKRKKTHKRHPSIILIFFFLGISTDNEIGERGATSLSEALKSNKTLTELELRCKDKKKERHKKEIRQNNHFDQQSTDLAKQGRRH